MKRALLLAFLLGVSFSAASQPLKQGVFVCNIAKNYDQTQLIVKQHPTKSHKIIINWEGRDRILHNEPTLTGALRYEGAVSKLVYIQTPKHSVLLDNNTMKPVLTDCVLQ